MNEEDEFVGAYFDSDGEDGGPEDSLSPPLTIHDNNFTEAPVVIWTTIAHPPTKISLNVTVRDVDINAAHARIGEYLKAMIGGGWIPAPSRDAQEALQRHTAVKRSGKAKAEQKEQAPVRQQARRAPPPAGAPGPQTAQTGTSVLETGTDQLNRVEVDNDGRVLFHVGRFRYPFKDARGGEAVAKLFDPDLGWQSEHFVAGADYKQEVTGLLADWEKVDKGGKTYYNIVAVHP